MRIALTGHRPEEAEDEAAVRYKFKNGLKDTDPECVIWGGAAGADLWGAYEAFLAGYKIWLVQPFLGHQPRREDRSLHSVLKQNSKVTSVIDSADFPGKYCYQKRNEFMVDNADRILAYYNGSLKGGTYNCLKYAEKVDKPVRNVYDYPPF